MTKTERITRDEAIKKNYLEEKKVLLKPSPRKANKMGITDPNHIAYFQIDQGSTFFCLPRTERGDLVNIFKDDNEREFFEKELGLDLNTSKPGNFFEKFNIQIIKDSKLMREGEEFDLSDPMDNLRVRILKSNPVVAPSWEDRKKKTDYKWAIIDQSKINEEEEIEYGSQADFWMLMGRYSSTPDMRTALKVFYSSMNIKKTVPSDSTQPMLKRELNSIANDSNLRNSFLNIVGDEMFVIKKMIINAMEAGAIKKEGNDEYLFTGSDETYTFNDIANKLYQLKNDDDNIYFRIKAQIEESLR